jgi:hypothetical protein
MTIAVAGNRAAAGIAIADINLKLIQEVIAAIRIGETAMPSSSTIRAGWSLTRISARSFAATPPQGTSDR